MTNYALNTGVRALLAAQFYMDTVGHNIANANVDGYSRQRVDLGSAMPINRSGLLIGGGVDALSVNRSFDNLLQRRFLEQSGVTKRLEVQLQSLYEIEAYLNEPGGAGLGGPFDGFFSALGELTTDPKDLIYRTGVVQAGVELSSQFNQIASGLRSVQQNVYDEVEVRVGQVNELAQQIGQLNNAIAEAIRTGLTPNDLMDAQDRAIGELSELVDVRVVRSNGESSVRVLVGGGSLVGGSTINRLDARRHPDGKVDVRLNGVGRPLNLTGGAIGGLIATADGTAPGMSSEFDELAHNLILEFNRSHAIGVPAGGSFGSLTAIHGFQDSDGDGTALDELIGRTDLPFEVSEGTLRINVMDETTGALARHSIDIDPNSMTVQDLLDDLNGIANLSASLDGIGRLQIAADSNFGFDFSTRLDRTPDSVGALGGAAASLGSGSSGPFALSGGDTLDLVVDPNGVPTPVTVTFDSADFADITQATPQEVADAINADPNVQASGMVARVQNGELVLQTQSTGRSAEFQVSGGTALAALGWNGVVGNTVQGSEDAVGVELFGTYTGDANETLTFRASGDGEIGTTPGLTIDVYDSNGQLVSVLDVGEGYQPGAKLAIGNGLEVSFGTGEVSATEFDRFSTDLLVESDTSDLLAATGTNAFFTGWDASTIGVREDMQLDPSLFATSSDGSDADTTQILRFLALEDGRPAELEGHSFGSFYGTLVSQIGNEVSSVTNAYESSETLLDSIQNRRDQVSGVNVDEELVDMVRFEQAFSAASRYINVVNQMADDVLALI